MNIQPVNKNSCSFNGKAFLVYHDKQHLKSSLQHINTIKAINLLNHMKQSSKNLYISVNKDYTYIQAGKDMAEAADFISNDLYRYSSSDEQSIKKCANNLLEEVAWRDALEKEAKRNWFDRIYYTFFPSESPFSQYLHKKYGKKNY